DPSCGAGVEGAVTESLLSLEGEPCRLCVGKCEARPGGRRTGGRRQGGEACGTP
ncbi:unnamed protein product, partial [Ectocarpus sp. 12 AP-2014]